MEDSVINKKNDGKWLNYVIFVLVLALIIFVAFAILKKDDSNSNNSNLSNNSNGEEITEGPDASISPEKIKEMENSNVEGEVIAVSGNNTVIQNFQAISELGEGFQNDAPPMSENAPKQTGFIDKETMDSEILNIKVGNNTFDPQVFTTTAGAVTVFTLTGIDDNAHIINFEDPSLSAITVLVGPGQTKAITFKAPETPGSYKFGCSYHKHAQGSMVVK